MPSRRHVSTGSTVDTFLPQEGGFKEKVFAPSIGSTSLGSIPEEEEEEEN